MSASSWKLGCYSLCIFSLFTFTMPRADLMGEPGTHCAVPTLLHFSSTSLTSLSSLGAPSFALLWRCIVEYDHSLVYLLPVTTPTLSPCLFDITPSPASPPLTSRRPLYAVTIPLYHIIRTCHCSYTLDSHSPYCHPAGSMFLALLAPFVCHSA